MTLNPDPRFTPPAAVAVPAHDARGPTSSDWVPGDAGNGAGMTSSIHKWLGIFYGVIAALVAVALCFASRSPIAGLAGAAIVAIPAVLHLAIAWGARRYAGWARVCSTIVGVLMLLGFPLGTIIGFFLLKAAGGNWVPPRRPDRVYADLRGA